jgi:hypothetical protein
MVRRRSTVRFRKGAPNHRRSGPIHRDDQDTVKIIRPSSDRCSEPQQAATGGMNRPLVTAWRAGSGGELGIIAGGREATWCTAGALQGLWGFTAASLEYQR